MRINDNQLFIGDDLVASWKDDNSKTCKVSLSLNGNSIATGATLKEKGTLTVSVTDESGNSATTSLKLNVVNRAPEVTVHKEKVDILEGKEISIDGNQVLIGDEVVASWEDDNTEKCTITLKLNDKDIKSGITLKEKGTLSILVKDGEGLSSSATITLVINEGSPEVTILLTEVDVTKGKTISRKGDELLMGDEAVVSWKDDNTSNCTLSLKLNDEDIKLGSAIRTAGTLEITVTDKDKKTSTVNIKLTVNNEAPVITLKQTEVNVFGGVKVTISENQLLIGDKVVASWSDARTDNCKVALKLNGADITSGTTLDAAGKLEIIVTDED